MVQQVNVSASHPLVGRLEKKVRYGQHLLQDPDELSHENKHSLLGDLSSDLAKGNPVLACMELNENPEELMRDYVPVTFKLAEPGVKWMNDKALGMSGADEFLDDLRFYIEDLLGKVAEASDAANERRMHFLSLNFKGGVALIKRDLINDNWDLYHSMISAMNDNIHEAFTAFLLEKISKEKDPERKKKLQLYAYEYGADLSLDKEMEGFDASEHDHIQERQVRLNFGFGDFHFEEGQGTYKDLMAGLMLSEAIANMVRRRQETGRGFSGMERKRVMKADLKEFFAFLLSDYLETKSILEAFQDQGNIAEKACFDPHAQPTNVLFYKEVIIATRAGKLEELYPGCRPQFYSFVRAYFLILNDLDILKPFLGKNFEGYIGYQNILKSLIDKSKSIDSSEDPTALIRELQKYKIVSAKDTDMHEQNGVVNDVNEHRVQTSAGAQQAILGHEDTRFTVFLDKEAFAWDNYVALAGTMNSAFSCFRGIEDDLYMDGITKAMQRDFLRLAFVEIPDLFDRLKSVILATADSATNVLIETRKQLAALDFVHVVEAGGDEMFVVLDKMTQEKLEGLGEFLKALALRAAPILLSGGENAEQEFAMAILASEIIFDALKKAKEKGEQVAICQYEVEANA